MATNKYIVLATQDNSLSKRFRIIEGGYAKNLTKSGSMERTITGKLDVKAGSILRVFPYIIKVRHTETDSNYGTAAELEALFLLNNPASATTPPLLKYTDHYGTTSDAYLFGDMSFNPLTTIIEGIYAWFFVQVQIVIAP